MKPDNKELAPNWWDYGICPITGYRLRDRFNIKKEHKIKGQQEAKWSKV